MVYIIIILLAVIAGELGWLLGRTGRAGASGGPQETEPEGGEFEKRWREGLDAMMGYDLAAARSAVRRDEDEE